MIGRQTFYQLSAESKYSIRTLKRLFHSYLKTPPVLSVYPSEKVNLLIDATYFKNNLYLVHYRDNTIKFTQLYRFTDGEWYEEIKEDLENLLGLGVQLESITCDGHKAILKAIGQVCGDVTLQRCVIHIQRQCRIWLSNKPKTEPGRQLRIIISKVHLVQSELERDCWIVTLIKWHKEYKPYIDQKSINPKTGRY